MLNHNLELIRKKTIPVVTGCFIAINAFLYLDTTSLYGLTANPAVVMVLSLAGFMTTLVTLAGLVCDVLILRGKKPDGSHSDRKSIARCWAPVVIKIVMVLLTFISWYVRGAQWFELCYVYLVLLVVSTDGIAVSRLFRSAVFVNLFFIILCFFLSMLGLISNNRGNSFGFIYRTDYACHILCLVLIWCLMRNGLLSYKGELALIVVTLIVWKIIGGKTALGCLFLLCVITFWRHYRKNGGVPFRDRQRYGYFIPVLFQIIYFPIRILDRLSGRLLKRGRIAKGCRIMTFSYLFFAVLIFVLTLSYRFIPNGVMKLFSRFDSLIARMLYGTIGFENYPVRPFGNMIPQAGNGGREGVVHYYYFLDSSYVKMLLEYGLVIFVIILGLMTWVQIRLYREHHYYAVFVLFLFALDCCMEHHLTDLSYNCLILLAFTRIDLPVEGPLLRITHRKPFRFRPKQVIGQMSAGRRRRLAGAVLTGFACLLGLYWCVSAYRISTFSGWTPEKQVTVVIPGSYLDTLPSEALTAARVDMAGKYLTYYREAQCIVSSSMETDGISEAEQIRDRLVANGIEENRIILDPEAGSVNEMLINASRLQEEMNLPVRRAVCTFAMQQARVDRHAKKLHIPTGYVNAKMPWLLYLPCYLTEQLKLWL